MNIVIYTAIWNCKEVIELLLKEEIDILKTFNFYEALSEDKETNYCKNEDVNCLDILFEKRKEIEEIVNQGDIIEEISDYINKDIKSIDECIYLIENHLKDSKQEY